MSNISIMSSRYSFTRQNQNMRGNTNIQKATVAESSETKKKQKRFTMARTAVGLEQKKSQYILEWILKTFPHNLAHSLNKYNGEFVSAYACMRITFISILLNAWKTSIRALFNIERKDHIKNCQRLNLFQIHFFLILKTVLVPTVLQTNWYLEHI